jgi:hypothetical protein
MKETTPDAMPPCFEKWCHRFDEVFRHQAQKKGFRHYLGGLLGESERKNITQMSNNAPWCGLPPIAPFLDGSDLGCRSAQRTTLTSDAAMQSNKA